MHDKERSYWVALSHYKAFGGRSLAKLRASFSSMEEAFHADVPLLVAAGIKPRTAEKFVFERDELHPEALTKQVLAAGLSVLTLEDETYPERLKSIYDPPGVLFVQGELPPNEIPHLAVVGSRACSPYGKRAATTIVRELADLGVVIVSGLAYGIDEAAHAAAVEGTGVTIAVLACGHDQLTSRGRYVANKIIESGGAVISEFNLGTPALPAHHPIRNRIISGLCSATLVVEAAEKSGSLITARAALEQGRDVFAIPGSIFSETSLGTNRLIQNGAFPVVSSKDIIEALEIDYTRKEAHKPIEVTFSEPERRVLHELSRDPVHIDELKRVCEMTPSTIAETLASLELKGRARQIGGMYYVAL